MSRFDKLVQQGAVASEAAPGQATLFLQSLTLAALVCCVEQVTVIDGPSGGSGAGGAPPSVSAAELQAACAAVCARASCDLWRGFCQTECASVIVAGCETESLAALQCLADAPDGSCFFGNDGCVAAALADCAEGIGGATGCDQASCIVEPGTCSCSGVCNNDVLWQDCVEQDDATAICTCYSGGTVLKTCESPTTSCELNACCG